MKHMSYLGNYDLRYPNVFHDTYPNDKVLYIVKKNRHVQVLIKYRDSKERITTSIYLMFLPYILISPILNSCGSSPMTLFL